MPGTPLETWIDPLMAALLYPSHDEVGQLRAPAGRAQADPTDAELAKWRLTQREHESFLLPVEPATGGDRDDHPQSRGR